MGLTPEDLQTALEKLIEWRSHRPAMVVSDAEVVSTPGYIGKYLLAEILELLQEIDNEADEINKTALCAEMMDVLIFLLITFRVTGFRPNFSLSTQPPRNFQEVRQKIDILLVECYRMIEGLDFSQLEQMFLVWRELAEYFSLNHNISMLIMQKLTVNGWNRPLEYYQATNQDEYTLSQGQQFAQFEHVEKSLKMIRKYFAQLLGKETPLYDWMHQPFANLILDYQNSVLAIATLEYELQHSQPIYQELFRKALYQSQQHQFRSSEFADLAVVAGGVVLPDPNQERVGK